MTIKEMEIAIANMGTEIKECKTVLEQEIQRTTEMQAILDTLKAMVEMK